MSPDVKKRLKRFQTPAYRATSTIGLLGILAQGYFDQTKQQIANDVMVTKVTLQHMAKQQDERNAATSIRIGAVENSVADLKIDFRTHCTNEDNRIAALWRRGKNSNQTDTLNSNQN